MQRTTDVLKGCRANAAPYAATSSASLAILAALSLSHGLNDVIQSLLPAIYPLLKDAYALDFAHIGLITVAFQGTASLLQPLIGLYTDKYPKPYSLAAGMGGTLCGLVLLSIAASFATILVAAALIGLGSSIFHPESSRMARVASGGRHGFAQSLFQVGGNIGSAIGPLLAAFIVVPNGQKSVAWFSVLALIGMAVLFNVGRWYSARLKMPTTKTTVSTAMLRSALPKAVIARSIVILIVLMFSKFVYLASMSTYLTFYLISRFHVSVPAAQLYLFLFLVATAAGTFLGGPIGDRIGRKPVIWVSILGVLPFTVILPHADLFWTALLTIPIGLVLASAFSAIIVFAQDIVPGRPGVVGGLFFGLAFGMGGIGAAVLGEIADRTSIETVFQICAWLPALGLLTAFLPNLVKH